MEPEPRARAADRAPDVDPDAGTLGVRRPPRPLHLEPRYVLLVAAGGVPGALARYGLGLALPGPGAWPLPTLVINLAGAFVLGVLLEVLTRIGPDHGPRRALRLLVGTGFLGAFTTYSTFAVDADRLFVAGRLGAGLGYVAASLLGGVAASFLGIWLGARSSARRAP
ncbi:fluoride efflux transporter FluC [Sinomonas sp.]|jgi:CrcB protein|uniref:fluoride efflux transporter FluC n=1 Tax=Sinomonas sp. TaxID=1914986 RepID=UPI002FE18B6A